MLCLFALPQEYYSPLAYVDEDVRRLAPRSLIAPPIESWRSRERMRTQCVALVACLNIGVDPPDVVKPSPCARVECWVDPDSMLPAKALKAIGAKLQVQYERWQERARYKTLLDPTAEELRKALIALRRIANDERVLLHYNGHGVPKPTANGEIWVYNKGFTQYIPVSLYDLQTWMGGVAAPSAYVFDCSNAGIIVDAFQHFIKQRREKLENKLKQQQAQQGQGHAATTSPAKNSSSSSASAAAGSSGKDGDAAAAAAAAAAATMSDDSALAASLQDPCRHVLLAACGAHEQLPLSNPDLPADLFTACLTTPIPMALRWFVSRSLLNTHANSNMPGGAPGAAAAGGEGSFNTPSGSNSSSPSNRQRLYELIDKLPGMRKPSNRKSPYGELNWIFTAITDSIAWNILPRHLFHKLFRQDLLVSSLFRNFLLAQRIMNSHHCTVISVPAIAQTHLHPLWACWDLACDIALSQLERFERHGTPFSPSTFFEEQLTSFEIWLEFGSAAKPPPMQLPVVLQVLLSTDHRLRALQLLARFIDKGLWAVNLALSVGIFPYVLKLLQSPSKELREVLVFIWAKILALDRAVQQDLSKIEYASYFVQHLLKYQPPQAPHYSMGGSGGGGGGGLRMQHSRSSSMSPSPYLQPTSYSMNGSGGFSMHSTPASTPFQGFSSSHGYNASGPNSAVATPLVHGMTSETSPPQGLQQQQLQASSTATTTTHQRGASGPPPLDLPPSGSSDQPAPGSHSAHLRDHPPPPPPPAAFANQTSHIHLRAHPLHDPASRLADAPNNINNNNNNEEEKTNAMFHSALPPMHPQQSQQQQQRQRVPFPLDLSAPPTSMLSSNSPLQSPNSGGVAAGGGGGGSASSGSNRPSPMLSGLNAFSPISPMLSPQVQRAGGGDQSFAGQARFEEKQQPQSSPSLNPSLPDSMSDAHDLTRLAREILATTPLQHLLTVFVLSSVAHANPKGQQTLLQSGLTFKDLVAPQLMHAPDPRLRKWTCLCIAKLWQGFGHAKSLAAQEQVPEQLCQLLMDPVPEVRCAALYALGLFFGGKTAPITATPAAATSTAAGATPAASNLSPSHGQRNLQYMRASQRLDLEIQLGQIMCTLMNDGSPLVRRELQIALAELIYFQQDLFLSIATAHPRNRESISPQGWHIWRAILRGCRDCSSQVQEVSLAIKGYLKARAILNQSQLGRMIGSQHNPGLQFRERGGGGYGAPSVSGYGHAIEEEESTTGSRRSSDSRDSSPAATAAAAASRNSISTTSRPSVSTTSSSSAATTVTEQSIAHFDHDDHTVLHGDDGAPLSAAMLSHEFHDRDAAAAAAQHQLQSKNMPPIRHFNRYKMGHLRPGPQAGGPAAAGGATAATANSSAAAAAAAAGTSNIAGMQRRSTDKSSILKSLEGNGLDGSKQGGDANQAGAAGSAGAASSSGSSTGTMDERAADQMWQVPKSRVFDESFVSFGEPMLVNTSEQIVPSMVSRHCNQQHKAIAWTCVLLCLRAHSDNCFLLYVCACVFSPRFATRNGVTLAISPCWVTPGISVTRIRRRVRTWKLPS